MKEENKTCKPNFVQSISIISQSPPTYIDVSVQPPPSSKDLFPNIFRTFSRTVSQPQDEVDGIYEAQTHVRSSSHEETRSQNCKRFVISLVMIVLSVGFVLGVIW